MITEVFGAGKTLELILLKMSKSFLCFTHIEKCGGTTLHHILMNNCFSYLALSSHKKVRRDFSQLYLQNLRKIFPLPLKGIGGHTVFPIFDYNEALREEELFMFTFLRDPVKRYMSHLNYQINSMGIEWKVESFVEENRFSNFQVRKIAGEEDLEKAKQIVSEKMNFVGLVEKFDESLLLLQNQVDNYLRTISYERANVHKNKKVIRDYKFEDLPLHLKSRIMDKNKLDIKLLDFVKNEIYPGYKERYNCNLEEDLKQFKLDNRNFGYSRYRKVGFKVRNFLTRNVFQRIAMKGNDKVK